MRRTVETILYAAAIAAAAAGAYALAERAADELETRTGAAVRGALSRAEIDWAWVEINGMQATLRGPAPDEAARFRALAAAGEVLSPLNLRDEMSVAVPDQRPQTAFRIELMRNGDSVLAHGLAPEDGAPELEALQDAGGSMEIVDLVARSSDPPPESWGIATDLAVEAVDALRTVRVIVTPGALDLEGIAPDRETAHALKTKLAGAQYPGLETAIALQLPRPVLSPFLTRFTMGDGAPRFDFCAAESEAGRVRILTAAAAAGVEVDCPPALGAPDQSWSQLVADGVELVTRLGAGTVTFSDLSVTVSLPPEATAHEDFDSLLTRFELALPEIYALSVIEQAGGSPAGGELRFTATRSPEGLVNLRGPVGPLDSREIVQALAEARFGSGRLHTALRAGAGLPEDWPVQVMAAVDALSHLDAGMVTLTPDLISIRGSTGDPEAEPSLVQALTENAGATFAHEIDLRYEEAFDQVIEEQGPSPEDCVSRINALLEAKEVSFPPGSVEIDADGLDAVGAIAEVLYDCPDVAMEIGGHTDSQGREEMNQLLSQARADAVLNALIAREVLVGNLTAKGYGETQPIADNETAEGREANRRIRFSLIDPSGAVIAADPEAPEETPEDSDG